MADYTTNLHLSLVGEDKGAGSKVLALQEQIKAFQQALKSAMDPGTSIALQRTIERLGKEIKDLGGPIRSVKEQIEAMTASVTAANAKAVQAARELGNAYKQVGVDATVAARNIAAMQAAPMVSATSGTGRNIGVGRVTTEDVLGQAALIQAAQRAKAGRATSDVIAAETGLAASSNMNAALERNVYYKNQDAVATARLASEERMAAEAAMAHTAALRSENANIQGRIDALTGVSRARAAESVFGTMAVTNRRGQATGARYTSAFGPLEGEGAAAGPANMQELKHLVAGFDELASGRRGQFFSTLGASLRDAGLGAKALSTGIAGFAAFMAGNALVKSIDGLARWAESAKASAQASGMTINEFTRLQGALELLGDKEGSADASMRQFAHALSEAVGNAGSKSATAFHNLGVSQEQLTANGNNTYKMLLVLSEAMQHDTNQTNIAANATELFGRSSKYMLGLMQEGPEKIKELGDAAAQTGNTLDEQLSQRLIETGEKINKMDMATKGLARTMLEGWLPQINAVIDAITTLSGWLTTGTQKLQEFKDAGGFGGAVAGAVQQGLSPGGQFGLGQGLAGLQATIQWIKDHTVGGAVTAKIPPPKDHEVPPIGNQSMGGIFSNYIEQYKLGAAQKSGAKTTQQLSIAETNGEIEAIQQLINANKGSAAEQESLARQLAAAKLRLMSEELSAGIKAAKQSYEDFKASEQQKIAEAKASSDGTVAGERSAAAQIESIYKEWSDAAIKQFHVVAAEATKIETARIKAAKEANNEIARTQMRDIEQQTQATELLGRAQQNATKLGIMSQGKGALPDDTIKSYQADQEAATRTLTQQLGVYQEIMNNSELSEQVRQEAALKTLQVYDQQTSRIIEDQKSIESAVKAANSEMRKSFEDLFNKLGDNVNKFGEDFLKAVIAPQHELIKAGLTTINVNLRGQEIKSALTNLATSFAGSLASAAQTGLSRLAASGLNKTFNLGLEPGQGMGGAVGAMIGKAFGFGTNQSSTQTLQHAGMSLQTAATQLQAAASTLKMGGAGGNGITPPGGLLTSDQGGGGAGGAMQIVNQMQDQTGELSGVFHGVGSLISTTVGAGTTAVTTIIGIGNTLLEGVQFLMMLLNAKPSVLGTTYSMGGVVSAAGGMAVGGIPGGGGQVAVLHSKEMVLPRHLSEGVQHAINNNSFGQGVRGNVAQLHYNPTINYNGKGSRSQRAEMNQLLESNAGSLAGQVRRLVNQGWRG